MKKPRQSDLFIYITIHYHCDINWSNPKSLSLADLACPVVQVINVLVLSVGAVLVIMILLGAYKYATSLGDPKGAMGARNTLTYAFFGLFIILGIYVLFRSFFTLLNLNPIYAPERVINYTLQERGCTF